MSSLSLRTPSATFGDLFHVENSGAGIDATIRVLEDGLGNDSGLLLSNAKAVFKPPSADTANFFEIQQADATVILSVNSSTGNLGIGTTAPDKPLEINSATGLGMRLTYNDADGSAANYVDYAVTSGGNATITPSGGIINLGSGATQTIFPLSNDAATPTLAFGDGDTGFYEASDDDIRLSIAGSDGFRIDASSNITFYGHLSASGGNGPKIFNETVSAVNPTLCPHKSDDDTGIGRAAADQLSLIAGGVEGIRVTENTTITANVYGDLSVSGANFRGKVNVADANYGTSALTDDYIIAFTSITAARTVVISTEDRDTGTATAPRIFHIKDESGSCSGVNTITISLETAGNIDGAATVVLSAAYNAVSIYVDGTNGFIY